MAAFALLPQPDGQQSLTKSVYPAPPDIQTGVLTYPAPDRPRWTKPPLNWLHVRAVRARCSSCRAPPGNVRLRCGFWLRVCARRVAWVWCFRCLWSNVNSAGRPPQLVPGCCSFQDALSTPSHPHERASCPLQRTTRRRCDRCARARLQNGCKRGSLARPLPDAFVPVAAGAPAALASGRSPTDGAAATGSCAPAAPPPRLLDRVRHAIRVRHYAIRTESAYVDLAKRFILFHGKRYPAEMGAAEVETFLTHLAVERHVAASGSLGSSLATCLSAFAVMLRTR